MKLLYYLFINSGGFFPAFLSRFFVMMHFPKMSVYVAGLGKPNFMCCWHGLKRMALGFMV